MRTPVDTIALRSAIEHEFERAVASVDRLIGTATTEALEQLLHDYDADALRSAEASDTMRRFSFLILARARRALGRGLVLA